MDRRRFPYWRTPRDHDFFEDFFDDFWPRSSARREFDIFDEFEDQFRRMRQRMSSLYHDTLRGNVISPEGGGNTRIYGWTFKIDSDGKPVFQEFGNVPRTPLAHSKEELPGSREPLIDVQESDKDITVIAEIPGVSKEDVDLEVNEDYLTIRVDNPERKYYKEVKLPEEVDPDTGNARFNNGVLSVTLKKLKPKKKGKRIKVD
ncbi:MAG: Hsp20/alpha crystallin family protein [Thermoplasmata archaeon]|nr:MAG: Hsp20/alpha crystallin family protein [Thermoplasmata archaeon]